MDPLLASSLGSFMMVLCQGLFTAPSWRSFTLLACGWALAGRQHTSTTSLWLTGATTLTPVSRVSVFLGCPFSRARWRVWTGISRHAAQRLPAAAPLSIELADTTKKKAGRHIEAVACSRNGAGAARQAYRPLRGLNFGLGVMRVPLRLWPGHAVSVPLGLALYLKEEQAARYHQPYRSRSALARSLVAFGAAQVPGRQSRAVGAGGYATEAFRRDLPDTLPGVSRFLRSGKLEARPEPPAGKRRGRRPRQGLLLGSPKRWARTRGGWQPQPTEVRAAGQSWVGLWHAVLPGRLVHVVVGRRPPASRAQQPGQRQPRPPVAAFFTTDLARSVEDLVRQDHDRGAVDITIRDSKTCEGLGQDQGRKRPHIGGAKTVRLVRAAARTLWFLEHAYQSNTPELRRHRPWSRQKGIPSQLDIAGACREALHEAGAFPLPRFIPAMAENHQEPEQALPSAA